MKEKQPNPSKLKKQINLELPIIAFYDAPDPKTFEPLVVPNQGDCIFKFFEKWKNGETLHITTEHYGCGGAGRWMCGIETRSREDFIKFLVDGEGLKASKELMEKWIDSGKKYKSYYSNILIGPLKPDMWEFARGVTFFVNPDQLSVLAIGAQYHSAPDDPTPVIAPFGAGCMQILPFKDLNIAQASIGTTDIAMRQHIPPDILSFSVTRKMFQNLCELDENSFLYKPFLKNLKKARGLT